MAKIRSPGLSARFFLALAVLLGTLAAVAFVAVRGLDDVQAANEQVYADNYLTAETTSELAVDLSRAEAMSLRITASDGSASAAALRADLHQIIVPQANVVISRLLVLHRDDPPAERRTVNRIPVEWKQFLAVARRGLLSSSGDGSSATGRQSTAAASTVVGALGPLVSFVFGRVSVETQAAAAAHSRAHGVFSRSKLWLLLAAGVGLVAAAAIVRIGLRLRTLVGRQAAEQRYGETESEYIDTLQVTENEDEAQELLRRHLERSLPGTRAVVLARNNSADRLEPKTSLVNLDDLREPLEGATPRSCLAVRFGRAHEEGDLGNPLMSCAVCGQLPGVSHCEPLLVSGEVIGAVLLNQPGSSDEQDRRRIREAVGQAAPVLGNLRNLAISELRASTDALTGLPNQRAVQDTLKRMVAQASRTISPLAALLVDVDHFKQINDLHGHDRGDEALAAVGITLKNIVRDSDFVGRYGGEEFLILLPSTGIEGAIQLAEAVRQAIAAITWSGFDCAITASVGVAILPDHAGDSTGLFRSADRALYAAKQNGRNRVEVASTNHPARAAQDSVEMRL